MSGLFKVLDLLKKVLEFLNGKKTYLSLLAISLTQLAGILNQIVADTFTPDLNGITKLVGYVSLIIGLVHKLIKGE